MTAVDLEAGNTRVRDYADIYTLTGAHDLAYAPMRRAIEATAGFRGIALRPLSEAVGDLVATRAATYEAYWRELGPFGRHLPERFTEVVAAASSSSMDQNQSAIPVRPASDRRGG